MLQNIWTSFRYGNRKTKSLILFIFVLLISAAACLITAVAVKSVLWGLGGTFLLVFAIIMMTSVSFQSSGRIVPEKENIEDIGIEGTSGKKRGQAGVKDKEDDDEEEEGYRNYLTELKQSDVKRIMAANKVKKDYLPVMIDICHSFHIKQCPAYIWVSRGSLYMLLLEKQARRLKLPLSKLTKITYKPGVTARRLLEYQEFQKTSFTSLTFGSLLPTYYEENDRGRIVYKKNLYVLEPDITFTNTSINSVMKLLKIDVTISDVIMRSDRYSVYFKEGYKINTLWKDGVYNTQEFKAKIKSMLQSMAEAEISNEVFNDAIKQLILGRLVTKEYAEYYIDYRKKYERKKR